MKVQPEDEFKPGEHEGIDSFLFDFLESFDATGQPWVIRRRSHGGLAVHQVSRRPDYDYYGFGDTITDAIDDAFGTEGEW